MCVNVSPGCLLREIRQLPNYSLWQVLRRNDERKRVESFWGGFFPLSLQLCCCWEMQGRWKMQKRERSPPAELRDVIVSELLNKIFRCFESPQKLKQSIHTSSLLNPGVSYASFQVLWGFKVQSM